MLNEFGCDETLRFARRYRDLAAPRATALDRRYWTPEREVESDDGCVEIIDAEPPETAPTCAGVRRGSAHPCTSWR